MGGKTYYFHCNAQYIGLMTIPLIMYELFFIISLVSVFSFNGGSSLRDRKKKGEGTTKSDPKIPFLYVYNIKINRTLDLY